MARIIQKNIEIEERELIPAPFGSDAGTEKPPEPEYHVVSTRKFAIKKYTAMDGLKVAKTLATKILPVFQNFLPLVNDAQKGANAAYILANLGQYLSMETIAETLDKVSPDDLDFIMRNSLMCVYEILPAGEAQVMNPDGTYGVLDVEYDSLLVLRLFWGAVMCRNVGYWRFFRRKPLGFNYVPPVFFLAAHPENLDQYLHAPWLSKHWRQHELWDGTYTLDDLADYHEMMLVSSENDNRAHAQIKAQMETR